MHENSRTQIEISSSIRLDRSMAAAADYKLTPVKYWNTRSPSFCSVVFTRCPLLIPSTYTCQSCPCTMTFSRIEREEMGLSTIDIHTARHLSSYRFPPVTLQWFKRDLSLRPLRRSCFPPRGDSLRREQPTNFRGWHGQTFPGGRTKNLTWVDFYRAANEKSHMTKPEPVDNTVMWKGHPQFPVMCTMW